ncbi:uncharacterized protein LOC117315065 [Pecten maximus]|uniref:uncharacterized protein LOC117315065 n=1 Tax=Pecten maximus TaxID=6579 RepID=UPI001458F628|nr:uncharacterized protein LOC117315065 [Pecten maximus]
MEDEDMQYDFSKQKYPKRGLVYIIVNERYSAEGYPDRHGAYTDYRNMKNLFKPLNLKLMTYYDKTGKQIKDIIQNASKRPDLADRPCFICVISSHGEQWPDLDRKERKKTMEHVMDHVIVGVDGMGVLTKDLVGFFSKDKCFDMVGKPKLFFIQACRETFYSNGGSKAVLYSTDRSKAVLYSTDRSKAVLYSTEAFDRGVAVQYVVSAKLTKHRRMRQRLSLNTKYDSADSKPNQSEVPLDALDHIIDPTGNGDSDDDDQLSDGYDTATTDEDSDADSDRETGHEEIKKRDRSVNTENEEVISKDDVKIEIRHIQATTPSDQNKDLNVVPKEEEKTEIQQSERMVPSGVPLDQDDAGASGKRRVISDIQEAEPMEVTAIPCHDDMLVMFASPPGKIAWRSTSEGSWLLANLYNVFKQYIRSRKISERDFLSILIEVSQDVSLKETNTVETEFKNMKMVPTIYHRLTKEVVMCFGKETGLLKSLKRRFQSLSHNDDLK